MMGNVLFDEDRDRVCLQNTQSAQGSRGRFNGSLAMLYHETDIKESGTRGGD
jgi:hypothetical protein